MKQNPHKAGAMFPQKVQGSHLSSLGRLHPICFHFPDFSLFQWRLPLQMMIMHGQDYIPWELRRAQRSQVDMSSCGCVDALTVPFVACVLQWGKSYPDTSKCGRPTEGGGGYFRGLRTQKHTDAHTHMCIYIYVRMYLYLSHPSSSIDLSRHTPALLARCSFCWHSLSSRNYIRHWGHNTQFQLLSSRSHYHEGTSTPAKPSWSENLCLQFVFSLQLANRLPIPPLPYLTLAC
jgi:hypothetical protein